MGRAVGRELGPWAGPARPEIQTGRAGPKFKQYGPFRAWAGPGRAARMYTYTRGPSPNVNSTRGKEKGGAAYRRRERSSEGRGWLREVLAVTTVYGSMAEVAGIDRSTRAGG